MKTNSYTRPSILISLALTTLYLYLNTPNTFAAPVVTPMKPTATYVVITRYEIQERVKEQTSKALATYAQEALADEHNIMAEVYQEQDQPFVLWVLERWSSEDKFKDFSGTSKVKEILAASKTALFRPIQTYYLTDLAPLSKTEWRRGHAKDDKPIVIMLFVESKAGTEDDFKNLYATAMPQFRSEPGVITYGLSQSESDKTLFVTYEKFRNEDAFQYHLNFPPIQPVIEYLNSSIKKRPFQAGLHRLVAIS